MWKKRTKAARREPLPGGKVAQTLHLTTTLGSLTFGEEWVTKRWLPNTKFLNRSICDVCVLERKWTKHKLKKNLTNGRRPIYLWLVWVRVGATSHVKSTSFRPLQSLGWMTLWGPKTSQTGLIVVQPLTPNLAPQQPPTNPTLCYTYTHHTLCWSRHPIPLSQS